VIKLLTTEALKRLNEEVIEQGKLLDKFISEIQKANRENSEKEKKDND